MIGILNEEKCVLVMVVLSAIVNGIGFCVRVFLVVKLK